MSDDEKKNVEQSAKDHLHDRDDNAQHHEMLRLLSIEDVAARIRVHRITIWRWVRDGKFPQPIRLADTTVRWPERDVENFIEKRRAVSRVPKQRPETGVREAHEKGA